MRSSFFILVLLAVAPLAAQEPRQTKNLAGQPCWILQSDTIEVALTQLGGHMAPVTFRRQSTKPLQPYYVSPWQEEKLTLDVPVLVPLRGDFFCMPFGGNGEAFRGEKHPPHGEVAGAPWKFVASEKKGRIHTLTTSLETKVRPGKVTKKLMLIDGQDVIYSQHVIEGFVGPTPLGHHATLALPEQEGQVEVVTSPFRFARTNPVLFSDPKQREYQSLRIGAKVNDLRKVPTLWQEPAEVDVTKFPARTGFADLVAVFKESKQAEPAWHTVHNTLDGYIWFALKDAEQLPATVFWIENRGRHAVPWNGRNRCLGQEDVCAYFAEGLVPSTSKNLLNDEGVKTALELQKDRPTKVNYIQGCVPLPGTFGSLKTIEYGKGSLTLISDRDQRIVVPVHHEFIRTGELP